MSKIEIALIVKNKRLNEGHIKMIGTRIHNLTIVGAYRGRWNEWRYQVKCDCSTHFNAEASGIKRGITIACRSCAWFIRQGQYHKLMFFYRGEK